MNTQGVGEGAGLAGGLPAREHGDRGGQPRLEALVAQLGQLNISMTRTPAGTPETSPRAPRLRRSLDLSGDHSSGSLLASWSDSDGGLLLDSMERLPRQHRGFVPPSSARDEGQHAVYAPLVSVRANSDKYSEGLAELKPGHISQRGPWSDRYTPTAIYHCTNSGALVVYIPTQKAVSDEGAFCTVEKVVKLMNCREPEIMALKSTRYVIPEEGQEDPNQLVMAQWKNEKQVLQYLHDSDPDAGRHVMARPTLYFNMLGVGKALVQKLYSMTFNSWMEKKFRKKPSVYSEQAARLIGQYIEAVRWTHARGVALCDANLKNVLLEEVGKEGKMRVFAVRLSDFGGAKMVEQIRTGETVLDSSLLEARTREFTSVVHYEKLKSLKTRVDGGDAQAREELCEHLMRMDWFAVGVAVYQAVTGYFPFQQYSYGRGVQVARAGASPSTKKGSIHARRALSGPKPRAHSTGGIQCGPSRSRTPEEKEARRRARRLRKLMKAQVQQSQPTAEELKARDLMKRLTRDGCIDHGIGGASCAVECAMRRLPTEGPLVEVVGVVRSMLNGNDPESA